MMLIPNSRPCTSNVRSQRSLEGVQFYAFHLEFFGNLEMMAGSFQLSEALNQTGLRYEIHLLRYEEDEQPNRFFMSVRSFRPAVMAHLEILDWFGGQITTELPDQGRTVKIGGSRETAHEPALN